MRWTYFTLFAFFAFIVQVAGLPSPIRTGRLRASTARKHAIAAHRAQTNDPTYAPPSTVHADHLIELQVVTHWLNQNNHNLQHGSPCESQVKAALNGNDNLAMVPGSVNQQKSNTINARLARGNNAAHFTTASHNYIQAHSTEILRVARLVDATLRSQACGVTTGTPIETLTRSVYGI